MFLLAAMSAMPTDNDLRSDDDHDDDVINISEEEMGQGDDYILSALAELENAEISEDKAVSDQDESDFLLDAIDETDDLAGEDVLIVEMDVENASVPKVEMPGQTKPLKDTEILRKELRKSIYEKLKGEYEGRLKASETRIRTLENDLRTARSHAEEKVKETKEIEDKWVRVSADYQNFQKRAKNKLGEFVELERLKVLREIVPVFENLKRPLEYSGDLEGLVEGINLIYKQFNDVLNSMGVKEMEAENQPFDPFYHEALHRIENTDVPNNTILEVLGMGFYINDRVLRPAKVAVSFNPVEKAKMDTGVSNEDSIESDEYTHESDAPQEPLDTASGDSSDLETGDKDSENNVDLKTTEENSGGNKSENSVDVERSSQDIDNEYYVDGETDDTKTDDTDMREI